MSSACWTSRRCAIDSGVKAAAAWWRCCHGSTQCPTCWPPTRRFACAAASPGCEISRPLHPGRRRLRRSCRADFERRARSLLHRYPTGRRCGCRTPSEEILMDLLDARLGNREERVEAIPLRTAAERRYERAKRVLDVTVALTALIVLSPVLLLMALAIKLTSKGPVFYQGTVHGGYGVPFTWHKFRSMVADGDDAIHRQFIAAYVAESRGGAAPATAEGGLYK